MPLISMIARNMPGKAPLLDSIKKSITKTGKPAGGLLAIREKRIKIQTGACIRVYNFRKLGSALDI